MNNAPKSNNSKKQDLYVAITVILMMIAVIVAIAVSLAKNTGEINKTDDTTDSEKSVLSPAESTQEADLDIPSPDTEDVFLGGDETDGSDGTEDSSADTIAPDDTEKTDSASESEQDAAVIPDFISPVKGEVLKGCSLEVPVFSMTMEDYRTHSGVDLYCSAGSDIACAARGTVKDIWDDPMMGTCISVEHHGGAVTVYKNLSEDIPDSISVGTPVEQGQVIATAGDTALLEIAEDSHVHLELYIDGSAVDPCEYFEFSSEPVFSEE